MIASENVIEERRARAQEAWGLTDQVVLIGGGGPISIPGGADQCFPYKPHPDYFWLTNRRRELGVLAFDPAAGWTLFEPHVTEHERVWGGSEDPVGLPLDNLERWLSERSDRPLALLGVAPSNLPFDEDLTNRLGSALLHARRPKDEAEIDLMRLAAKATAAGYESARRVIRPGVTERQIKIELESAFVRAGADGPGYSSVVGIGPNSAVFHFTPGARAAMEGDLVLIDAGAEVSSYVMDVTRTYPASSAFTAEQQAIYDAVLKAELLAIDACRPNAEWHEVHRLSALSLSESLRDYGILKCSPEEAVESEAIALFFPHGIGHMVGLGVRDASGPLPTRSGKGKVAGVSVRMDIPLLPGYSLTIEPGIYFIPALLNDPKRHARFADQINWSSVAPWIGKGGIRIEDTVIVTNGEPLVLSSDIPK